MAVGETARLLVALELKDKFSGQLFKATASLSAAEKKLGTLDKVGLLAGRGIGAAANNIKLIGLASAAAIGGIGLKAIDAAVDFEDAFAGIRKTVNQTDLTAAGLTFEDLSDSIRKMAREIPVSAVELAAIGEAAGALGVKAGDIDDFIRVVAELSATTNLTSEEAATALGHLGTTLDLTGDEFRDFADSLVQLGNTGASTEAEIIDIAQRFAAAGTSAGLTKEEILALASATASMGIDAEAAGSSLSRVFSSVATNIGTSNKKAKAFADAIGLSAAEFRESWEKDAVGTFNEFLEKLNTLDQFEASALLKKVGITGVRDINAVRLMAQNIDDVNDALANSRNSTDALGIEARKKFETTASQLKILRQNFTDIGITIGSAVLPKITDMTKKLVEFVNTPKVQKIIEDIAASLPGGIDKLVAIGTALPWDSIGDAFKLMGEGAKAAMDLFLGAPPWLQTAIVTGWGLNKLTGGALGSIVGTLGSGLIKGVLGMNAGVVNINAAVVNGGPGGGVPPVVGASPLALLGTALGAAAGLAVVGIIGAEIDKLIRPTQHAFNEVAGASGEFNRPESAEQFAKELADTLDLPLDKVKQGIVDAVNDQGLTFDQAVAQLEQIQRTNAADSARWTGQFEATRASTAESARWAGLANAELKGINAKKFDPTVTVNVAATANISVSNVARTLTSFRIAGSTTVGGFTESAF